MLSVSLMLELTSRVIAVMLVFRLVTPRVRTDEPAVVGHA